MWALLGIVMLLLAVKGVHMTSRMSLSNKDRYNKIIGIGLFILCGLPLILYPLALFFLIWAHSSSSYSDPIISPIALIIYYLFVFLITIYPIVYIISMIYYSVRRDAKKIVIAFIPLIHLFSIFISFFMASLFERIYILFS